MDSKASCKNHRIWPPRKASTDVSIRQVLRVESIDLCFQENGEACHTASYEMMIKPRPTKRPQQLVVRRGTPFVVRLVCNRRFDSTVDTMVLVFSVDACGTEVACFGNGTETYIVLHTNDRNGLDEPTDEWGALLTECEDKPNGKVELKLLITTPSYAPVARWNLEFNCRLDTTDAKSSFSIRDPMYVLFNPWCKEDTVYMEDEASKEEYVLSDSTMICKPSANGPHMTNWYLGQYEPNIVDCALYIISEIGKVKASFSGNPVLVTRALTGSLNSANGEGVLQGNWTGDYEAGTAPTSWTGSVKILQDFYESFETVKYGQCWVYGGVFTTVCRAIGIPSRILTNFDSAGDHDASLTIDYFLDESDNMAGDMTVDSVWNYHVWNEAWMKRKELQNPEYDGWQALDATPQVISDGMYKCGPCPVNAIKQGFVHVPYDAEFIYAEVNADLVYWSIGNSQNPPKPLRINTQEIGHDMTTKAIGQDEKEDITQQYKFPEGSKEEREAMKTAMNFSCQRFSSAGLAKRLLGSMKSGADEKDDKIKLELKSAGELKLGSSFHIELLITSISASDPVELSGSIVLKDSDYTGRHTKTIKKLPFAAKLDPKEVKSILVPMEFNEYHQATTNQTNIRATCMADVKGSDRTVFVKENFHLSSPTIEMTLLKHNDLAPVAVQVDLNNPLPIPLTFGRFIIEGSRFTDPIVRNYDVIPVGGKAQFIYPINLSFTGKMVVCASFVSKELKNVRGDITVNFPTV
ncbi:annulin-like [Anopheles nili]|uniref:annulin-like n=1 Tax=Anopheles nili TaxID=185578 RepID=UPI00237A2C12|nr:annulin-like [Anopheles nili]